MRLHERIAGQYRDNDLLLAKTATTTAAELARYHGVSRLTMLRALRLLRAEGALDFGRGRRVRRMGTEPYEPASRTTATDECERHMAAAVQDGTWRTGARLPKVLFLAGTHRVSRSVVTKALLRLAGRDLTHKQGRFWFAGAQPRATSGPPSTRPPVIVLLMGHEEQWSELFGDDLWGRFANAFSAEAEDRGVQLLPVLAAPPGDPLVFTVGREAISGTIGECDASYLGTVVLPIQWSAEEVLDWRKYLTAFGRPVLTLFPGSTYVSSPSKQAVTCMAGSWGPLKYGGAASVAADLLKSLGHRRIGVANLAGTDNAAAWRLWNDLHKYGILTSDQVIVRDSPSPETPSPDTLRELALSGPRRLRGILAGRRSRSGVVRWEDLTGSEKGLVRDWPVLARLVDEDGCTALVGPNDRTTRRVYYWCRAVGIRIPRDLSLMSFGNTNAIRPYPLSSIDLGQRRLGYKAFHYLMGDLTVRPTKYYQLWGGTSLNHRGSVGPAPIR